MPVAVEEDLDAVEIPEDDYLCELVERAPASSSLLEAMRDPKGRRGGVIVTEAEGGPLAEAEGGGVVQEGDVPPEGHSFLKDMSFWKGIAFWR